MATNPIILSLRGLSRNFQEGAGTRSVLRGLDLDVARGETVSILGRSGGGKSTLLNLISGIDFSDAGDITVDGASLTAMNERARTLFRRRHIGFIYQFFNLIPTLTVAENVFLPLELNDRDTPPAREAARGLLAEVGLGDRLDAFPDRLSAGEQQRVAIARALVHDPLLVLADEPTGNLDADTGRQVLALLDRLVHHVGKTMIVVTHSKEVAQLGDRVLALENGRLAESTLERAW